MRKTKIEWVTKDDGSPGMTWNPISGCLHGCEYCYARRIARRFASRAQGECGNGMCIDYHLHGADCETGDAHVFDDKPLSYLDDSPYPWGFDPTFHSYRLAEPQRVKKPQTIFVCSMADLFGEWVPFDWIFQVFRSCYLASQHRYIFLTKNPVRYLDFPKNIFENENLWWGATITDGMSLKIHPLPLTIIEPASTFYSIEPLCGAITLSKMPKWVIVGAENGNRKGKVVPEREWIEEIVQLCRANNVPVFLKNSLASIWREPLIQEYPW